MKEQAKVAADKSLRVGVVGVGVMGSNHARVFADLPGVTLVGIADPEPKQRDFVTGALGCQGFADVDGLLAAGVDAVTIAAPTHLHRDIALACISQRRPCPGREADRVRRSRRGAPSSPPRDAPASR